MCHLREVVRYIVVCKGTPAEQVMIEADGKQMKSSERFVAAGLYVNFAYVYDIITADRPVQSSVIRMFIDASNS